MKSIIYLFLIGLLACSLPAASHGQREMGVTGFVVDEDGRPVEGASVRYVYEPRDTASSDGLVVSSPSFDDGSFGIRFPWIEGRSVRVLIEEPNLCKCSRPIDLELNPFKRGRFGGILISEYRPELDLGGIRDFVRYGKVEIDVSAVQGEFDSDIGRGSVRLRVLDSEGRIASDSTVGAAYSAETRSVTVCLPYGEWVVELHGTGKTYFRTEKPLKISAANDALKLYVRK